MDKYQRNNFAKFGTGIAPILILMIPDIHQIFFSNCPKMEKIKAVIDEIARTERTRVITTTKDHLEESMMEGRFREDLFFRINVMSIIVPPLRERREQIPPLAGYFYNLYTGKYAKSIPPLSPKTIEILHKYDWPGNIRELENVIKRIVLFGEEEVIGGSIGHQVNGEITPFSAEPFRENGSRSMETLNLKRVKSEAAKFAEKELIQRALQETRWNRKRAAGMLGVSYKALLYKMHKYRMGEI